MVVHANFDRGQEQMLWEPVLLGLGYDDFVPAPNDLNEQNVIDASVTDRQGHVRRLALRSRSGTYAPDILARYKREFTIRRSRPSGNPVEWDKLFRSGAEQLKPDLFCYGWRNFDTGHLDDYVILSVPVLCELEREGHLSRLGLSARNVDALRSEFVVISLADLLRVQGSEGLVVHHSPDHPGVLL